MPNPHHPSEVPSDLGESCDFPPDLARSFTSLDAFEIIDAEAAAGSRAGTNPIIAQAWIARLEFPDPSRAAQSRACRYLIRKRVSTSGLIDERLRRMSDCSVRRAPSGEPRLFIGGEPSTCQVSISHSSNWLGVAITLQPRIGIDVEASKPRGRFREMAEYLGWGGKIANFDEFQALWTLWEACVKLQASSIFSPSSPAFEALCRMPGDRLFWDCGPWVCVRSCPPGKAHFALVLELESPRRLLLRHRRPEYMDLDVTNPEIHELRVK